MIRPVEERVAERHRFFFWREIVTSLVMASAASVYAQEPAPAAAHLVGTVTVLSSTLMTLTSDKGEATTLTLSPETRVLDLPPGSTDLKAAHPGDLHEIEVGDRVLITSIPGTGGAPGTVRRIVVMKSAAIAQQRQTEQAGWARSRAGTLDTVDVATGAITMSARGRIITLTTTPATIYRRYAADSARFEDTKRSSLAELHPGDQLRVRGEGTPEAVQAIEIVSGTFEQIAGSVIAADTATSTLTLRDSRTKQPVIVTITPRTEIHQLPQAVAAQFAERSRTAGQAKSHQAPASTDVVSPRPAADVDLGQVVAHLPDLPLSEIKVGESILLIATGSRAAPTAMTVLSGVAPILAAVESGGAETSLAPWSMSGGESAGSGSQ